MQDDWLKHSLALARTEADFYSGARKIIRGRSLLWTKVKNDLQLEDCGYTKSKQSMLVRNYLNVESRDACLKLWERRLEQNKYGSVGFSTYNHFVKGGGLRNPWEIAQAKKSGKPYRASVMGPCIQSCTITLLKKGEVAVDMFYRTTELFKKFPADLVFIRDVLLPPFDLGKSIVEMRFHFANITLHPMYFVTVLPLLDDPIGELERIRKADKYFFDWIVKWSARYLCKEHNRGIDKFAQALRVQKDALNRITGSERKDIVRYLNKHHPGYRKDYVAPEDVDE
jgi:hypothetical protein